MPLLSEVACILFNIPSSSAFIERFYSVCGNVCNKKAGNMTPNTLIQRSFLKANYNILGSISIEREKLKAKSSKETHLN